jgi:PST family polysaccharide transporter
LDWRTRADLIEPLVARLRKDKLLRGFGALGLGEACVRLSRIVTIIVLARCLDAAEIGVAATALACFELVRVLANNGIGQMVVRAPDERLAAFCNTAYRLTWIVCVLMAAIQLAAAAVIAYVSGRPELFGMIGLLCLVYAFMPWGMVNFWLLQRQYRMGGIAAINTAQVGTDNLLTAGLAFAGIGPWAIVAPKLLTMPIWLVMLRRMVVWRREPSAGFVPYPEIARFAGPVLASEILLAARFNLDKVIVGAILGIEALGIYYFAFGAGYGLTMVLTSALVAASFPHLAAAGIDGKELLRRFDRALIKLALPISGLIVLQAMAVFIYVPILFGEKWTAMTPLVAILCVSAATKPWYDLSTQLLRAAGMPVYELVAAGLVTICLLGALAAGLTHDLLWGVSALAATTILVQLAFTMWARAVVAERLATSADPSGPAGALSTGKA